MTSHDVRDYDFQLPPVLARAEVAGKQRDVVFGGGKAGIVIAWDRTTHRRLWQSRVGLHLNDAGPLGPRTVRICPGFFGGIETPMAYAAGTLYVPVVNLCTHGSAYGYQPIKALDPVLGTGEFVALDTIDGTVSWRRVLPQPDFGCATAADGATRARARAHTHTVFTVPTIDGRLYAFAAADGTTLWQARAPAGVNGCPALSGRMLLVPAGSGTTRLRHPQYGARRVRASARSADQVAPQAQEGPALLAVRRPRRADPPASGPGSRSRRAPPRSRASAQRASASVAHCR